MSRGKKTAQRLRVDLPVVRGVPTVRHRIAAIERCITAAAAMLDVPYDDLHTIDLNPSSVALSQVEAKNLIAVLQMAADSAIWLSNLPADILDQLAPTHDQREALRDDLLTTDGAR